MARSMPRRWLYFGVIACVSLLFLHQLRSQTIQSASEVPITAYRPAPKPDDGKFHWSDYHFRYPLGTLTPLPTGKPHTLPKVQHNFASEDATNRKSRLERREKVKQAFAKCWKSYRTRAWLHDELAPLSGGSHDFFGGWGATLVDALDTLWIMDLKDEFREAVDASIHIDFSSSHDSTINIFETTIRYLGGFLAAFDLSGDERLLHKAVEVGEMLLVSFDTPNHMPITRWEWRKAATGIPQEAPPGMLVSEIGSLTLEFTRLSQLTGNMRWYDAIARVMQVFEDQQNQTHVPGMWPIVVNPRDQNFTEDTSFTLGGMSDSLYEYLPKQFALLGGLSNAYRDMYNNAMQAVTHHLLFRPSAPGDPDILMSGDIRAAADPPTVVLEPRMQHLSCFAGGMFALGGRLFSNEEHLTLGRKLTQGCIWAYHHGPHGIMPEIANFLACPPSQPCPWDPDRYTAAVLEHNPTDSPTASAAQIVTANNLPMGFTSYGDRRYILRPEAIESVFIMYRVSGEEVYRDMAWKMFQAIEAITTTEWGNAAVADITIKGADGLPPKDDRMESFWLGETLKYFYLLYSEPNLVSLDEFMLNTEAHPLRRPS